jgi:hypothetical protein
MNENGASSFTITWYSYLFELISNDGIIEKNIYIHKRGHAKWETI